MTIATREFDAAEYLDSEETMAEFLSAALETGDPAFIAESLGVIARARGIAQIAEETGLGRTSLYKALRAEGNPAFSTVLQVMRVMGLSLQAKAVVVVEGQGPAKFKANPETVAVKASKTARSAASKKFPAQKVVTAHSKKAIPSSKSKTATRHSKGASA